MSKKLIEVALPLEAINAEAAREKSIRHGHPSTLHLWWARRPLAAARAVIWSSLVDDPSAHPELYPTEEAQNTERQRLFGILEKLVKWENSNDPEVLAAAKAEILRSTNNNPPALLDPFAGGGAIPLEAQRLGLEAHAHDLNPVAVMINKAMIELPPRFAGQAPVNPDSRTRLDGATGWQRAQGLAADVQYYGEWMKREAFRRIGHLYPKVKVPHALGGGEATVIAWIWARTVKCPNPACGCEMPLASTFVLSKKKGNEAWIEAKFDGKKSRIEYIIHHGKNNNCDGPKLARGAQFKCIVCSESITANYIKNEAQNGRMKAQLIATVAEGHRGRTYISPDIEQEQCAQTERPMDYPEGEISYNPRDIRAQLYGLDNFSDLFTNRQLTALTTFSALVAEAQAKAEADAVAAGVTNDHIALSAGGSGARAYGEAVGVYLAFVIDKMTDYNSSVCSWHNSKELIRNTFGRQAIPMAWDYAEVNPFSNSTGSYSSMICWLYDCLQELPAQGLGEVSQFDAQSDCGLRNIMVSSDPPYYDNIGYPHHLAGRLAGRCTARALFAAGSGRGLFAAGGSGGLLGIQLFLPGRVQSCRVAGGAVQQHRAILDVQNGHAVHVQCAGIHAVQGHLLCRGRRLEGIKFRLLHGHIPHAVGGVKAKNKCSIVAGSRTVIGRTGNSDRLSQRLRRCLRIGYRLAGTAVHRRKGRRAAQQAQAQGQCRCKNPELFFHRTHPPLFAGHPAILRFDRTSCFSVQQFPECVVFRHIPTHSGSKISSHHILYHFMFIYEP